MTGVQRGHHAVAVVVATAVEELRATHPRWGVGAGADTEAGGTRPAHGRGQHYKCLIAGAVVKKMHCEGEARGC